MKLSIRLPVIIGTIVLVTSASISFVALQISSARLKSSTLAAISAQNEGSTELLSATLNGQLDVLWEIANRERIRTMDWEQIRLMLRPDVSRIGAIEIVNGALKEIKGAVHLVTDMSMGAADYIRKPCKKGELLERISKNIRKTQ